MRAKLAHEPARVALVHSPIDQVFEIRITPWARIEIDLGNRASPVAVPVPHTSYVSDLTKRAVLRHIDHFFDYRIEAMLMSHLKHKRGMRLRCLYNLVALFNRIHHRLF